MTRGLCGFVANLLRINLAGYGAMGVIAVGHCVYLVVNTIG